MEKTIWRCSKEIKTIEGEFIIKKGGKVYIDGIKLTDNDEVEIKVKVLKGIIKDAKAGII